MMPKVYADNAATTKLDREAFEIMRLYMLEEYGNASQPYSFARAPKRALQEARAIIAQCINALPGEIYFTSGGTESDNWAIKGVACGWPRKSQIITSKIEHHAVLRSCAFLEQNGYAITYLPATRQAIIENGVLVDKISSATRLVSVMTANNEVGSIQPIRELVKTAHANGALFHTDAVQAVGHINVDVRDSDVDLLSASAHKFNGPKGIGFLYIKTGIDIKPCHHGGAQEDGMRAGTENIANILGMAIALRNNCRQLEKNIDKLKGIEEAFLSALNNAKVDYILNGSEQRIPGNISISIRNADGEMLLHRLDLMGITVSTGAACDSKETRVSHVLNAMGVPEEYVRGTIRVSFGKDNCIDDALFVADSLKKILVAK